MTALNFLSLNNGISNIYNKSYSISASLIDQGKTFFCRNARAVVMASIHACCLLGVAVSCNRGLQIAEASPIENSFGAAPISGYSFLISSIFGIGAALSGRSLIKAQRENNFIRLASKELEDYLIANNNPNAKEGVVVIFPERDPELAIYNKTNLEQTKADLTYISSKNHERSIIPIWTCGSNDLKNKIKKIKDKLKNLTIRSVIINGHGTKDFISFGDAEGHPSSSAFADQIISTIKNLNFKQENGSIFLISCSSGKKNGISEEVSKAFPKALVYGASDDFSEYLIYENWKKLSLGIQYFNRDIPENITKIYENANCRNPSQNELTEFKMRVYSSPKSDAELMSLATNLCISNK